MRCTVRSCASALVFFILLFPFFAEAEPAPDSVPKTVMAPIAAGPGAAMAIRQDGSAWAWGLEGKPWTEEPQPVQFLKSGPPPDLNPRFLDHAAAVAVGDQFSLTLRKDGTLWGLGRNDDARLGNPFKEKGYPLVTPAKVMDDVAQVVISGTKTCVVKKDGSLWTWGSNIPPAKLLDNVRSAAIAYTHGLALMRDGSLMGWGDNTYGELGDGPREKRAVPAPVMVKSLGDSPVISLATTQGSSVAVTADGRVHQWGAAPDEKLPYYAFRPELPATEVRFVSLGKAHALVIKTDGTLWAMGGNASGEIGDGTTAARSTPAQVLTNVTAAAAGPGFSIAMKADGTVWTWGNSKDSALGVNGGPNRLTPGRVQFIDEPVPLNPELSALVAEKAALPPSAPPVRRLAIGSGAALLLRKDATLWQWETFSLEAGKLPNTAERLIVIGDGNAHILRPDGVLWDWITGYQVTEQNQNSTPSQLDSKTTLQWASTLHKYGGHTLALMRDGTLQAWGDNSQGQLGDGTRARREAPVTLGFGPVKPERVTVLTVGFEQSALVMDGVLWLWGKRGLREDTGSPRSISTPRPLAFAAGEVLDVALGEKLVLILTKDGTVWSAGNMLSGQTGNGVGSVLQWQETPYKVLTGVLSMTTDNGYCLALKKDGSLWGWGRNYDGGLGKDRNQEFLRPQRIKLKFMN